MADIEGEDADGPEPIKVIRFDPPLKFGGEEYASIELREPLAGELEDVDSLSGIAWTNALIAKVASIPKAVVRLIPQTKLNACSVYFAAFVAAVR